MGKNASGQTHYLSLSGFELYGTVNGVCEDQLGNERTRDFSKYFQLVFESDLASVSLILIS